MIKELDLAVLRKSVPEQSLKAGDVGTGIHVHKKGEAFEVEFLTLHGETVGIATVTTSQVEDALLLVHDAEIKTDSARAASCPRRLRLTDPSLSSSSTVYPRARLP